MKTSQFTMRDLLSAVLLISVTVCWYVDRRSLRRELIRLQVTSGSYHVRLETMRGLSNAKASEAEIRLLIYAVSDPDVRIAKIADGGLRKVSGIRDGFGSIDFGSPDSRLAIMKKWIDWHLSHRS